MYLKYMYSVVCNSERSKVTVVTLTLTFKAHSQSLMASSYLPSLMLACVDQALKKKKYLN